MTKLDPTKVFPPTHWSLIEQLIAINTAQECGATDKGMVDLLDRTGSNIEAIRNKHKTGAKDDFIRFEFSSKRKRMSTIGSEATGNGGYDKRLYHKGASELVLAECSHYIDAQGQRQPITDGKNKQIKDVIEMYADKALRTIGLAYRDLEKGEFGDNHDAPEAEMGVVKDVE